MLNCLIEKCEKQAHKGAIKTKGNWRAEKFSEDLLKKHTLGLKLTLRTNKPRTDVNNNRADLISLLTRDY